VFCALAIAGAVFLTVTFKAVLVLFAGILFALVLRGIALASARAVHVPYPVALAVVVVLGLGGTVLSVVLFAPAAVEEFRTLEQQLPVALNRVADRLQRSALVGRGADLANGNGPTQAVGNALGGIALTTASHSVEVVAGLVVIFFIGVYGAAQPQTYVFAALALTPGADRERVLVALQTTGENLTRWLLGRLVAMIFVGVTTSIAFHLFKLPLAVALGIFAGLLTFVEYAGAVISAIPPLLLALAQSTTTAVSVLVLYTVLHVIEGYVLTPLLARASVRVPPAIALGSQVLLGTLAGPLGITFSTPLLVVAISSVRAFREHEAGHAPA
jgi:predicted PurR-regulated permease PerM